MKRWIPTARFNLTVPMNYFVLALNVSDACLVHRTTSHAFVLRVDVDGREPQSTAAFGAAAATAQQAMSILGMSIASAAPGVALMLMRLQATRAQCDGSTINDNIPFMGNAFDIRVPFSWELSMDPVRQEQTAYAKQQRQLEAKAIAATEAALRARAMALAAAGTSAGANSTAAGVDIEGTEIVDPVRPSIDMLTRRAASFLLNPALVMCTALAIVTFFALVKACCRRKRNGGGVTAQAIKKHLTEVLGVSACLGLLIASVPHAIESAVVVGHFAETRQTEVLAGIMLAVWVLGLLVPCAIVLWPWHFDAYFHLSIRPQTFFADERCGSFQPFVEAGEWKSLPFARGRLSTNPDVIALLQEAADSAAKTEGNAKDNTPTSSSDKKDMVDAASPSSGHANVRRRANLTRFAADATFTQFFFPFFRGTRAPHHYFMLVDVALMCAMIIGSGVTRTNSRSRCVAGMTGQFATSLLRAIVVVAARPDSYLLERYITGICAVIEAIMMALQLASILSVGVGDNATTLLTLFNIVFVVLSSVMMAYKVLRLVFVTVEQFLRDRRERKLREAADEEERKRQAFLDATGAPLLLMDDAGNGHRGDGGEGLAATTTAPSRQGVSDGDDDDITHADYVEWIRTKRLPDRVRRIEERRRAAGMGPQEDEDAFWQRLRATARANAAAEAAAAAAPSPRGSKAAGGKQAAATNPSSAAATPPTASQAAGDGVLSRGGGGGAARNALYQRAAHLMTDEEVQRGAVLIVDETDDAADHIRAGLSRRPEQYLRHSQRQRSGGRGTSHSAPTFSAFEKVLVLPASWKHQERAAEQQRQQRRQAELAAPAMMLPRPPRNPYAVPGDEDYTDTSSGSSEAGEEDDDDRPRDDDENEGGGRGGRHRTHSDHGRHHSGDGRQSHGKGLSASSRRHPPPLPQKSGRSAHVVDFDEEDL